MGWTELFPYIIYKRPVANIKQAFLTHLQENEFCVEHHFKEELLKNIATGKTSQVIISFDYYNFTQDNFLH